MARAVNYIPDLARPKTSRGRGQGVASHHAADATLRGPVCPCERSKEAPLARVSRPLRAPPSTGATSAAPEVAKVLVVAQRIAPLRRQVKRP